MVYLETFDEFQKAVEDLYANAPNRSRLVVKYRHCDGELVMKITDGPLCIKYRTDRQQDLKKFEKLNTSLMLKMQQRKVIVASQSAAIAAQAASQDTPSSPAKPTSAIPSVVTSNQNAPKTSPQTPSSQAGKKKKKKK
ncbi:Signal recognition particle protein [Phlyctochytrium planicorne]|nr:Signal recognition particle protein [Phlyctochytrium planicorne]